MHSVASFGDGQIPTVGPSASAVDIGRGLSIPNAAGASEAPSPKSLSSEPPKYPKLDRPTDLCVSPDGLIYVVDFGNSCVRVY